MSVKNFKKRKHRFVQLTMIISEIYYSKKSDVWMMRKRASIGHFLGKLFWYHHGNCTKKYNKMNR